MVRVTDLNRGPDSHISRSFLQVTVGEFPLLVVSTDNMTTPRFYCAETFFYRYGREKTSSGFWKGPEQGKKVVE